MMKVESKTVTVTWMHNGQTYRTTGDLRARFEYLDDRLCAFAVTLSPAARAAAVSERDAIYAHLSGAR